jgi:hypothetical protein
MGYVFHGAEFSPAPATRNGLWQFFLMSPIPMRTIRAPRTER